MLKRLKFKKKINSIFDLLWKLPKSFTDRTLSSKVKDLKIGENQTITLQKVFISQSKKSTKQGCLLR